MDIKTHKFGRAIKDLTGQRFGRLTVLSMNGHGKRTCDIFWLCRCDCGKLKSIQRTSLARGTTQSCGCFHQRAAGLRSYKHGMTNSPEFRIWNGMKNRCGNPNCVGYKNYGERGIKVCDRWMDFSNFLADMGRRPSKGHSIERIDNDKGYEPGNCKWATLEEQHNNRRDNVTLTHEGKTLTIAQWARELSVPMRRLWMRKKFGWSDLQIITTPARQRVRV